MDKLFLVTQTDALPPAVTAQLSANGFGQGDKRIQRLTQGDGTTHLYVSVAGQPDFWLGAQACARARDLKTIEVQNPQILAPDVQQDFILSWLMEAYGFGAYKSKSHKSACRLTGMDPDARTLALASGIGLTRDLINTPANHMMPGDVARAAQNLAEQQGANIEVICGQPLKDGFPLIYAVGAAAQNLSHGADLSQAIEDPAAPRLIDMRWGPADGRPLTLVGKGIAFDTGGLNLKPGTAMRFMKKDMGGAAHALGLAHMIMALGLPIRLRVLIPTAENAVSGNAFRPGDILTARNGLKVEIDNTDAEGRLVLADALTYAQEGADDDFVPSDLTLSLATLKGAARVALGPAVAPFLTNQDDLTWDLLKASKTDIDPLWPLPLYKPYDAYLKSDTADLVNSGGGGFAGAITAALFLRQFIGQGAWAHFDIYGWNPDPKPGCPKGAAAQGLISLITYLEAWAHD